MSLKNIIKLAKGDDEERVGMSMQVPISVKEKLHTIAKENKVSINSLINAFIKQGFGDVPIEKELYLELIDLEKKLSGYLLTPEQGGELFCGFYCNPGAIDNFPQELESIISRVVALRKILYKD